MADQSEVKVPDMSCNHCVKRISNALKEGGIETFHIDLEKKEVRVNTTQLREVLHILEEIDYPGSVMK